MGVYHTYNRTSKAVGSPSRDSFLPLEQLRQFGEIHGHAASLVQRKHTGQAGSMRIGSTVEGPQALTPVASSMA